MFSRELVVREVDAREGSDEAAAFMDRTCWREHRPHNKPLVIDADNGWVQKAHTLKSKLERLAITLSHCCHGVSDDNAHIELGYALATTRPVIRRMDSGISIWRGNGG